MREKKSRLIYNKSNSIMEEGRKITCMKIHMMCLSMYDGCKYVICVCMQASDVTMLMEDREITLHVLKMLFLLTFLHFTWKNGLIF